MDRTLAGTGMQLSVTVTGAMCTDDMAMVPEVIAGETRHGLHAGGRDRFHQADKSRITRGCKKREDISDNTTGRKITMAERRSLITSAAGILILALIAAAGCTASQPATEPAVTPRNELVVFTAASLTGAMTDIAAAYEKLHPETDIIMNFDGSQALRTQIEQGARADLFLSANTKHMTALEGGGLIDNGSVRVFAKNKLALVVPKDNPAGITGLSDLAQPGTRIVMGTKDVPFGDYTRQALGKMAGDPAYGPAFRDAVMANVISEETAVTALVAKLRLGEADAGIAYASDVSEDDREYITPLDIPDEYNVIATYPLGIVQESEAQDRAAAFSAFITSPDGAAILVRYGFVPAGS
jgi:molybdate transport system substrate-binding protein